MGKNIIVNQSELVLRIAELKMHKEIQEEVLADSFKEILVTLDLALFFTKSTNHNGLQDVAKSGINAVVDLIIDLLLGKHRSVKGYLTAIIVEKFSAMLINNNITTIISRITSFFNKKNEVD